MFDCFLCFALLILNVNATDIVVNEGPLNDSSGLSNSLHE